MSKIRVRQRTSGKVAWKAECLSCGDHLHPQNNTDADRWATAHARANPEHKTLVDFEITTHYWGERS